LWTAFDSTESRLAGHERHIESRHIAEKPDLTLRALVAELAERGIPASYGSAWRLFRHEGISFLQMQYTGPAASNMSTRRTILGKLDSPRRRTVLA
jgi:transposase